MYIRAAYRLILPFYEATYAWSEQAKAYSDMKESCEQIIAYEEEFVVALMNDNR